jgi:DNA-binding Lrp family transcriptional regulator
MEYKIDSTDRQILYQLSKNSRIPETQLAKLVNKSKESVRYRIKKLIDEEIIKGFTTILDLTNIGFSNGKIYLNLANIPPLRKKFIEEMKRDKRLFWLGMGEGTWDIGLTFFVKSNQEFFDIKNKIFSDYNKLILESRTANVVGIYIHDKTFLSLENTEWLELLEKPANNEIDNLSKKILKEIVKNSRKNVSDISYDLKTTVEKTRLRLRQLEEKGIIKKYTIAIDHTKIGFDFYKTFLYFNGLNPQTLQKLKDHCLQDKNIVNIVKQISPWDIELESYCSNFKEYNDALNSLTEIFAEKIKKIETTIIKEDYLFPSEKIILE